MKFKTLEKQIGISITQTELTKYSNTLIKIIYNIDSGIAITSEQKTILQEIQIDFNKILNEVDNLFN